MQGVGSCVDCESRAWGDAVHGHRVHISPTTGARWAGGLCFGAAEYIHVVLFGPSACIPDGLSRSLLMTDSTSACALKAFSGGECGALSPRRRVLRGFTICAGRAEWLTAMPGEYSVREVSRGWGEHQGRLGHVSDACASRSWCRLQCMPRICGRAFIDGTGRKRFGACITGCVTVLVRRP